MAIRDLTARIRLLADTKSVQTGFAKAGRSFTSFGAAFVKAGLVITASALAIGKAFSVFQDQIQQVAQEDALNRQLEALGTDLETFLAQLQAVSQGTVATVTLINSAANALLLGIQPSDQIKLLEIARVSAIAAGTDIATAFRDITFGVARQSRQLLDNIGIIIKVNEANRLYAEQMKITGRELTIVERRQAFLNEALRIGEERIEAFGEAAEETNVVGIAKLTAGFKNLLSELLKASTETTFLGEAFAQVGDDASRFADAIRRLRTETSGAAKAIPEFKQRNDELTKSLNDTNSVIAKNQVAFEQLLRAGLSWSDAVAILIDAEKDLRSEQEKLQASTDEYAVVLKSLGLSTVPELEKQIKALEGSLEVTRTAFDNGQLSVELFKARTAAAAQAINALKTEIAGTSPELQKLNDQFNAGIQGVADYSGEISILERSVPALRREIRGLEKSLEEADSRFREGKLTQDAYAAATEGNVEKIAALEAVIADVVPEIQSLNQELGSGTQGVVDYTNVLEELGDTVPDLQGKISDLETSLGEVRTQYDDSTNSIEEYGSATNTATAAVEGLGGELGGVAPKLQDLNSEFEEGVDGVRTYAEEVDELSSNLPETEKRIESLGRSLKTSADLFEGGDLTVQKFTSRIAATAVDINQLENDIASIIPDLQELNEEFGESQGVEEYDAAIEALSSTVPELQTGIEALQAALTKIEVKYNNGASFIQSYVDATTDVTTEIDKLQTGVDALTPKIQSLNDKFRETQDVAGYVEVLSDLGSTAPELQRRIEELDRSLALLKTRLAEGAIDVPTFTSAVAASAEQLATLAEEVDSLTPQIEGLNAAFVAGTLGIDSYAEILSSLGVDTVPELERRIAGLQQAIETTDRLFQLSGNERYRATLGLLNKELALLQAELDGTAPRLAALNAAFDEGTPGMENYTRVMRELGFDTIPALQLQLINLEAAQRTNQSRFDEGRILADQFAERTEFLTSEIERLEAAISGTAPALAKLNEEFGKGQTADDYARILSSLGIQTVPALQEEIFKLEQALVGADNQFAEHGNITRYNQEVAAIQEQMAKLQGELQGTIPLLGDLNEAFVDGTQGMQSYGGSANDATKAIRDFGLASVLSAQQLQIFNETQIISSATFDRIRATLGEEVAVQIALQSGATLSQGGQRINLARSGGRIITRTNATTNGSVAPAGGGFSSSSGAGGPLSGSFVNPQLNL